MAASFFAFLTLPLIGLFTHWQQSDPAEEKRDLAKKPQLSLLLRGRVSTYLDRYKKYYSDQFGFRKPLVRAHAYLQYHYLQASTTPKVLVGKDGWLFAKLGVDSFSSRQPYTEDELNYATCVIEERTEQLAARGIHYLFVLVPNKSTIYPEKHPDWVVAGDRPSRMSQLSESPRVDVLDLRGPLVQQKPSCRPFHRTDTHWNDCGAFAAYVETLARLKKIGAVPNHAAKLTVTRSMQRGKGGDLSRMLLLRDYVSEDHIRLRPANYDAKPVTFSYNTKAHPSWAKDYRFQAYSKSENKEGRRLRLLLLGDSFAATTAYRNYLAEHFDYTVVVRGASHKIDPALLELVKPTVVVQESVERLLQYRFKSQSEYGEPSRCASSTNASL